MNNNQCSYVRCAVQSRSLNTNRSLKSSQIRCINIAREKRSAKLLLVPTIELELNQMADVRKMQRTGSLGSTQERMFWNAGVLMGFCFESKGTGHCCELRSSRPKPWSWPVTMGTHSGTWTFPYWHWHTFTGQKIYDGSMWRLSKPVQSCICFYSVPSIMKAIGCRKCRGARERQ